MAMVFPHIIEAIIPITGSENTDETNGYISNSKHSFVK